MRVFLVGVACVGKTTIGALLARRLDVPFFDLDAEIERYFGTSTERLQNRFLTGYSYRNACAPVLTQIAVAHRDCVIALPPTGLRDAYLRALRKLDGITVAVEDTAENLLDRIVFFDIDSKPVDKPLTAEEKRYHLRDIKADIRYFKKYYARADLHAEIAGLGPEGAAARIEELVRQH